MGLRQGRFLPRKSVGGPPPTVGGRPVIMRRGRFLPRKSVGGPPPTVGGRPVVMRRGSYLPRKNAGGPPPTVGQPPVNFTTSSDPTTRKRIACKTLHGKIPSFETPRMMTGGGGPRVVPPERVLWHRQMRPTVGGMIEVEISRQNPPLFPWTHEGVAPTTVDDLRDTFYRMMTEWDICRPHEPDLSKFIDDMNAGINANATVLDMFLKIGGHTEVMRIMRSFRHHRDVLLHGCRCLWILTTKAPDYIEALCVISALRLLTSILGGYLSTGITLEIQQLGLCAIRNIIASSLGQPYVRQECAWFVGEEANGVKNVILVMEKHFDDATIQILGCEIMGDFMGAELNEFNDQMKAHAKNAAILATKNHPGNDSVREAAAYCIKEYEYCRSPTIRNNFAD